VTDSLELIRGAIASLTSSSSGKTVVLGVDDVALLDDLSTFVVHQIIQRRAAKVVLTIREGEPVPTATRELWNGAQFDRLDLQPLSEADITELISATLGAPLDPQAAERLWKLTRGNPLYLQNIVEQEVADERLTLQDEYWRWLGDPVLPPSLVELIEGRVGGLPSPVSDVIDALAVGEPIELGSLTRITDPAAVEQADIRGLIAVDHVDDRVEARLAHPLYGEVRRSRAAPTRLRRLRGLVAAELAATDDPDNMRAVVRRAALILDSDLEPDADLLIRAAQGAMWLADLPLADRLAEAAIRAGGGAEANFVRAHALLWLTRGQEADAVLAAIPISELDGADHGRRAFLRAHNRHFALADPSGAKELIDNESRTAPPQARSCIDAYLAVHSAASGNAAAAVTISNHIIWNQLPDVVATITAMAIAVALGEAGRTTDAVAAADVGYAVATKAFDAAPMRFIIADGHIGALLLSGEIAQAWRMAEGMRRQAADLPGTAKVLGRALAGRAAFGGGHLDAARLLLEPVVGALTASGDISGWGYRYQLPHTVALAIGGSIDKALASLAALVDRRHPGWRYLDYEYAIAKAWVAAAQGAVDQAIATVLAAAETARDNGQFAAEVMCLQTATQLGDHSSGPRLRQLGGMVEGPRVSIAARFAEALLAGDGAELASVSEEFEDMGDLVAAVDAAAHAAIAYRRRDLRGSALGCSARAEALAEHCGGARTPALRKAVERVPLTDREREIVILIGQGLSNRDIAARLTLSVRTVESHIYNAMAKTGTLNRDELAALLPRRRGQLS
jgi:DNA-binding CsgD family transcriptional regulator